MTAGADDRGARPDEPAKGSDVGPAASPSASLSGSGSDLPEAGGFRGALAFLTPVGGAAAPGHRCLIWFPVVGALLGGALAAVWWGAAQLWPPLVAAILVVVADAALTGMLHLDGLADAADGLLPPLPRDRRLAVMAMPDVGAFGAVALVLALLLRVGALASVTVSGEVLVAAWAASRAVMAGVLVTVPYVGGGLAERFRGGPGRAALVLGVGAAGALLGATGHWDALAGLAAGLLLVGAMLGLARRRLGGFTGDVLGAAGVVLETAVLLGVAAS